MVLNCTRILYASADSALMFPHYRLQILQHRVHRKIKPINYQENGEKGSLDPTEQQLYLRSEMPANGDEVNSDSPASCRRFLLPHGRGMQSCTCHRYWMRQILYSHSFRATGGRRKGENRIKHRKRTQTKTSQMSST